MITSEHSPPSANADLIGSTTSVKDIINALAERGCSDLTTKIDPSQSSGLPLAGGGFCDVYRGRMTDGRKIAIKSLRLYDNDEKAKVLKRAARELYHWSKLKHPNVLQLMGLAVLREQLSMISGWAENGSLMSYIRLNPDVDRVGLCLDFCAGLSYIHGENMVHGDLKAANIMVAEDGTAMIADFGNSTLKELTLKFTDTTSSSLSVRWAAPELLVTDDPRVSKKSDVYACGMTILETLTGRVPYDKFGERRVLVMVAVEFKTPVRPTISMRGGMWEILQDCWTREPLKRPEMSSVEGRLREAYLCDGVRPTATQHLPTCFFLIIAAGSDRPRLPDIGLEFIQEACKSETTLTVSLCNEKATCEAIERELGSLYDQASKSGSSSRIFVYLTGRGDNSGNLYLSGDATVGPQDMKRWIMKLSSRSTCPRLAVIVIFDTCRRHAAPSDPNSESNHDCSPALARTLMPKQMAYAVPLDQGLFNSLLLAFQDALNGSESFESAFQRAGGMVQQAELLRPIYLERHSVKVNGGGRVGLNALLTSGNLITSEFPHVAYRAEARMTENMKAWKFLHNVTVNAALPPPDARQPQVISESYNRGRNLMKKLTSGDAVDYSTTRGFVYSIVACALSPLSIVSVVVCLYLVHRAKAPEVVEVRDSL